MYVCTLLPVLALTKHTHLKTSLFVIESDFQKPLLLNYGGLRRRIQILILNKLIRVLFKEIIRFDCHSSYSL